MSDEQSHSVITERFMAPFAIQGAGNEVTGIDSEGLVQRLLLFEHCIIPSIWLKDVHILLGMVDPAALCELLDEGALSFYIDSSAMAEIGQARSSLNLTGNTTRLKDDEFSFNTLRGVDDEKKIRDGLDTLEHAGGVPANQAQAVRERVEANLLDRKGLDLMAQSFKEFYRDLRDTRSTIVRDLIASRLQGLGAKPKGLDVTVEEFFEEDFKVRTNLRSRFGLSATKAREISVRALLDLSSVHIRLSHMREFNCLVGLNDEERRPWEIKVDYLIRELTRENQADRQFTRVVKLAGVGERRLLTDGHIDLRRVIELRHSEEIADFRLWLKDSDNKTDKEIRERISSVRARIGNAAQAGIGKIVRLMISTAVGAIPAPQIAVPAGIALGALDSFLLERLFPRDSVVSVVGTEYPAIFDK